MTGLQKWVPPLCRYPHHNQPLSLLMNWKCPVWMKADHHYDIFEVCIFVFSNKYYLRQIWSCCSNIFDVVGHLQVIFYKHLEEIQEAFQKIIGLLLCHRLNRRRQVLSGDLQDCQRYQHCLAGTELHRHCLDSSFQGDQNTWVRRVLIFVWIIPKNLIGHHLGHLW